MRLEGSCHCGAVRFTLDSTSPVPYQRCYCSICRKTAGTGGHAINLGADTRTMKVRGRRHLRIYRARLDGPRGPRTRLSKGHRYFCGECGTALWQWDPTWPELVHPHAGAIDTPLPVAPQNVHILLDSKAPWVPVEGHPDDPQFQHYPDFSLAQWHQRMGLDKL